MRKALWWLIQVSVLTLYLSFVAGIGLFFGASWMAKFLNVAFLLIGGKL